MAWGTAAIIAGALGLAGSAGNTILSGIQNKKNRELTISENAKNRALQKDLATNAYQYAVEDMKKAGLNPALAYNNGGAHGVSGSSIGFQGQSKIDTQSFMSGLSLARDFIELGQKKSSAMQMQPREIQIFNDYGVDNHYYPKG